MKFKKGDCITKSLWLKEYGIVLKDEYYYKSYEILWFFGRDKGKITNQSQEYIENYYERIELDD